VIQHRAGTVALAAGIDLDFSSMWTVWAALLGLAFIVLALVGLLAWLQGPPRPTTEETLRLRAEAMELSQQAAEVVERAARAQAIAQATRARCFEAQQSRELAWRAHDDAERAHAVARQEAVPAPRPAAESPLTQEVSRAALAAFKRGDLSVEELREVWQRAGGWDSGQDQQDQTLTRARAEEHRAQRAYELAAAGERHLCREAEIAEVAARALADEAVEASVEAHAARAAYEETKRAATRGRLRRRDR
jgi:hypothetical protein